MTPSRHRFPTASERPLADEPYYVVDNVEDAQAICETTGEPVKLARLVREEVLYVPRDVRPSARRATATSETFQTLKRSRRQNVSDVRPRHQ